MRYEGDIYRPPSEARSLILQATIGCTHNSCIFCPNYMGKIYRERDLDELFADIDEISAIYKGVGRVFLADGDALAIGTQKLLLILNKLYESFPALQRVSLYATARDILEKSPSELTRLRDAGLGIVYLGVETGNDDILRWINKGVSRAEISEAGIKARKAGLTVSVTVINGLGGTDAMEAHARDTASLLSEMDPHYIGLLTLMVVRGTPVYDMIKRGQFSLPAPFKILGEIKMMIEGLNVSDCVFRANHASNYLPLKGTLPADKAKLLRLLDTMLEKGDTSRLRPEYLRGL